MLRYWKSRWASLITVVMLALSLGVAVVGPESAAAMSADAPATAPVTSETFGYWERFR